MTGRLAHILRHPIKSIGFEEIERALLTEGRALPFDRIWAVAHEAARFQGQPESWQPKMNFLRGVSGPELMAISSETAGETLRLSHPRAGLLEVDLNLAEDRARLLDWLRPLWPGNRPAPSHVVAAPGAQPLTDKPDPWISVLSLSSLADLSARVGRPLSRHRFRGNLWVEGWPTLAERALVPGRRFRVGDAVLEAMQPVTRCRATCVNPETGAEDVEMLDVLQSAYGHKDFGIFARVAASGDIARGDAVEIL